MTTPTMISTMLLMGKTIPSTMRTMNNKITTLMQLYRLELHSHGTFMVLFFGGWRIPFCC